MGRKRRKTEVDIQKQKQFLDKIGNYLGEYQRKQGCSQAFVAQSLGYRADTFWRWINGDNPMPLEAIQKFCRLLSLDDEQTLELFYLAGYVISPTLSSRSPHPSLMRGNLSDDMVIDPTQIAIRTQYLEAMCRRYHFITLPIGPPQGFLLQAVFQPLKLRRDPLAAEDLAREERRALLGEQRQSDTDPRRAFSLLKGQRSRDHSSQTAPVVIAENGNDALKKSPQGRVVILGGPGTGKTTTLKYLVSERAQQALSNPNAPIPIFLSLPSFASSSKTFRAYLTDIVEDFGVPGHFADVLWRAIQSGESFLCLDSLDEVEPRQRTRMIELINTLSSAGGNIWIIGSRFTEYKGGQFEQGLFSEWELQPMSSVFRLKLVEQLLPKLLAVLPHSEDEDGSLSPSIFVNLLENHSQTKAWGENPLLFSLAAVVFVQTGGLPVNRMMLYRDVIEAMIKIRESDKMRGRLLFRSLTELALWVQKEKGRTFTSEDLLTFLTNVRRRYWGEAIETAHLIVDSGVIEVVARDTYGFRHQTFQEYLAAVELARGFISQNEEEREQARTLAWSKRTYSRWTEVLRLMVGVLAQETGQAEARNWLQQLIEQQETTEGDPGSLGLILALKSLGELAAIRSWNDANTSSLEEKAVSIWVKELFHSVAQHRTAKRDRLLTLAHDVSQLSESSVHIVLDVLIDSLNHGDRDARGMVLKVIGILGERVPLELLFAALYNADEFENATSALKAQGKRLTFELLFAALKSKHGIVQYAAKNALKARGESVPLEPLLAALHDSETDIRRAAVEALGTLGNDAPLEPLLAALHDSEADVRRAAVEALGTLGNDAPLEPLLAALHDRDYFVRRAAIWTIGTLGERVPLDFLLNTLHDEDSEIKQATLWALSKRSDLVPLEPLLTAMKDTDSSVRQAAVTALATYSGLTAFEPLIEALQDPDGQVVEAAIATLKVHKEVIPLDPLLELLHDSKSIVRRCTVEVIGALGNRIPLEPLIAALHDEDWYVQMEAAKVLGTLNKYISIEFIIDTLDKEYYVTRQAAVELLETQKEPVTFELLLRALKDKNAQVRSAAVEAFGAQGEHIPLEPLLAALHDIDPYVRRTAVEVLGIQGARVPLEPLLAALEDTDQFVRQEVVEVLGAQGTRVPLEPLLAALNDSEHYVRSAAVKALGEQGARVPNWIFYRILQSSSIGEHSAARQVLRARGEPLPPDSLERTVEKIESDLQELLANLGPQESLRRFLNLLHHENYETRKWSLKRLSMLGVDLPLEPLFAALHDTNGEVRQEVVTMLSALGVEVPLEVFLIALHDNESGVRAAAARALEAKGNNTSIDLLVAALGDEDRRVRQAAVQAIQQICPEALSEAILEAKAILQGQSPGKILGTLNQGFLADTIGYLGTASPVLLDKLTELLSYHYWQVRAKAARSLGSIRRNIPNATIRLLLQMRKDPSPYMQVVREAADDALAEILSLETGIEDD